MARLFEARPDNDLPDVPNYNICPTNRIAVCAGAGDGDGDGAGRRLQAMRWGFVPHWYKAPNDGPLLINARAETLAEKPAFKAACRERRCLIACAGFYEWTKDAEGARLPWYITRQDGAPLVLAGIWQDWTPKEGEGLRACAVVTCAANAAMAQIHHRMPVIVEPEGFALWLGEAGHGAARLMRAAPEDALRWHRVGREVNSNRAAGPDLIAPVAA